jgi:alkaline phosphatase D
MKRMLIAAPLLALVAFLAPGVAQESAPQAARESTTHELLHPTLYAQTAAEYRALCIASYAQGRMQLEKSLTLKGWSACIEQRGEFGDLSPAVILDADETALDNSAYEARLIEGGGEYGTATWLPWCREMRARAVPGALEFCKFAAEKGCTVFFITNRDSEVREETRANLKALGFPMKDGVETVLCREGTSDKGPRRKQVCEKHRVLIQCGDQLTDFASEFNKATTARRDELCTKYADWFGTRWIVLPNAMYGDWEASLYDYDFALPIAEKVARKRAKLYLAGGAPITDARNLLSAGPMPGYSEMTETVIWLQTVSEASVRLRYWPKSAPEKILETPAITTANTHDNIALFTLTDLPAGMRFAYEVWINGTRLNFDYALEFQTQPIWRWRGDAPDFTFTFGSCMYINDEPFDRPGKPYGAEYELLGAVASEKPDFMLWLGDNVYTREADWLTESAMRKRYRHSRACKELQPLLAATHHYATWDDHDYGPNDSDRSFRLKRESLGIFKDYWPGVSYGTNGVEGVFSRFEWADCEFFMLDDRYWRSSDALPAGREMFGKAQLQWLKDALLSSRAALKFIVCGGQMFNPMTNFESLGKYPEEQKELADFLVQAKISGAIVLSGDRHASELLKIERSGAYPLYEYTSSPMTAGPGRFEPEADNKARVPGTWVTNTRNYGKVKVSGKTGERTLTLSAHDKTGKELWKHEIKESELRFEK